MTTENIIYGIPERKPSAVLTIWNALWPPLAYFIIQIVVAIVATINVSITESIKNDTLDADGLNKVVNRIIASNQILLMGISMLIGLALFVPFFLRFHKGDKERFTMVSPVNILLIFLLTGAAYFAIGMIVSLLPQNFGGYDEAIAYLNTGSFWLKMLVIGIGAPLVEEFCVRGLCQNRLMRIAPPAVAIFLQAALFGVMHWNLVQSSYAFLLGLLLGWVYYRARTILAPILLHFFFNAGNLGLSELLKNANTETAEQAVTSASDMFVSTVIILVFVLATCAGLISLLNKTFPKKTVPGISEQ